MKKRFPALILGLVFLMCLMCGCGDDGASSGEKRLVGLKSDELLSVGDAVCPVSEAMIFVTTQKNIYQDSYGGDIWSVSLDGGTFESYILDGLKDYMGRLFAASEMARNQGMELTEDEMAVVADAASAYMSALSSADISAMKLDKTTVEDTFVQYILALRLYDQIMENENVEISDDQARVISIQRIYISTKGLDENGRIDKKNTAAKALHELRDNARDFISVAGEYSENDELDMEVVRGQLSPAEEEAAYGLASGEISDLVETADGFVIIKCISSYEEDASVIHKEKMLENKKEQVFQEYMDAFLKEHPAVFNEEAWKKISISHYEGTASANFYTIYHEFFTEQSK